MNFNLVIVGLDENFINHLNIFLENIDKEDDIKVYYGNFQDLTFDAIVSPANSYGIMDGGIDAHINNYLNGDLTYKDFIKMIQLQLSKKVNLSQQPGSAVLLESHNSKCPYIIHSPTMQIPSKIKNKEIIYWCIYNILSLVYLHNLNNNNPIKTVCMPGMGTGCGGLNYIDFVMILKIAYKHFKENIKKINTDWESPNKQYAELHSLLNIIQK